MEAGDKGAVLFRQSVSESFGRAKLPCSVCASGRPAAGIVGRRRPSPDLYLVAFDLLMLNGHDLRNMPVEDRREILPEMIPEGGRIQFSEALPGTGAAVYHLVDKAGLRHAKLLDFWWPQRPLRHSITNDLKIVFPCR